MPGNPRDIIVSAERRFPVRIRIGVPPGGFGQRYTEMTSWLSPHSENGPARRSQKIRRNCRTPLFRVRLLCRVVHQRHVRSDAGAAVGAQCLRRV
jgi:hypothetical protein